MDVLQAAKIETRGLTGLEYVAMCFYYNYEDYPEGFIENDGQGP
jgi:hypothetical protein